MEALVQKSKVQSDVRGSINARAKMAVADFFHSNGIAFSAVESPRFIAMCKALRFVADDFKLPNRKELGKDTCLMLTSTPAVSQTLKNC